MSGYRKKDQPTRCPHRNGTETLYDLYFEFADSRSEVIKKRLHKLIGERSSVLLSDIVRNVDRKTFVQPTELSKIDSGLHVWFVLFVALCQFRIRDCEMSRKLSVHSIRPRTYIV